MGVSLWGGALPATSLSWTFARFGDGRAAPPCLPLDRAPNYTKYLAGRQAGKQSQRCDAMLSVGVCIFVVHHAHPLELLSFFRTKLEAINRSIFLSRLPKKPKPSLYTSHQHYLSAINTIFVLCTADLRYCHHHGHYYQQSCCDGTITVGQDEDK